MEFDSILKEEKNENIQIYPPVKQGIGYLESKKFLPFFAKRTSSKLSVVEILDSVSISKSIEFMKENQQNLNNLEEELFLINKGIEQARTKSKRSSDVKTALENFLRRSDLIEQIIKFFEEHNRDKSKQKTEGKNDVDEDKEKLTEIYINSIVSKLADSVSIEKYNKNEFVIKMSEIGENCYFLLSGILSVLKPMAYHIELTYDEFMQYFASLIKNKEYDIIDNIRRINQDYIDIGLNEDLENFLKSYFIIKFKKDIAHLFQIGQITKEFIDKRFKLFDFTFEDFDLKTSDVNLHIEQIIKGSSVKDKELKDYLDSILITKPENLSILKLNPNILDNDKHKFTIFKYEDFLYLKPGAFFGESALDGNIHKRNASIRTEEDCIILSLHNDIYKALLFENNKKLKTFDVVFICKNFFFNDISTIIFNKNYFSFFKLLTKEKDDIIYKQSEHLSSVYFVKEGNIKLEISISITELYNLIKYYYDKLTNNPYIRIGQAKLKEIKENYLQDNIISDVRHQSLIMREKLNTKFKFELFTSSYCDTLGLEEYFLKNNYLCTAIVISKTAKLFEISQDSLDNIITTEKNCHNAYYNLVGSKLITLIKRLNTIKLNYINQLTYKIKENFFGTEVEESNLIKGQTGSRRPFRKYFKKKQEPKTLNKFYRSIENEEKKNQNFLSLKKASANLTISKNVNLTNNNINFSKEKSKENIEQEYLKTDTNKKNKYKKKKKLSNIKTKKNSLNNELLKHNLIFSKTSKDKSKENEIRDENDISKRIMETTIIKIGKDSLTLKEIGNKIKSTEIQKNTDLSIVKNFFNKTNSFSNTASLKFKDREDNYTNTNTNNLLSLKKHKNFFLDKNPNEKESKLPKIAMNRTNDRDRYEKLKIQKQRIKEKKIVLKPIIISLRNKRYDEQFKDLFKKVKNDFNVILTDQNNLVFN